MVKWISGKCLAWENVWHNLKMKKKRTGSSLWIYTEDTPVEVQSFLEDFGYNNGELQGEPLHGLTTGQLATVVLNTGFARWLCTALPDLALEIGIAEEQSEGDSE